MLTQYSKAFSVERNAQYSKAFSGTMEWICSISYRSLLKVSPVTKNREFLVQKQQQQQQQ